MWKLIKFQQTVEGGGICGPIPATAAICICTWRSYCSRANFSSCFSPSEFETTEPTIGVVSKPPD